MYSGHRREIERKELDKTGQMLMAIYERHKKAKKNKETAANELKEKVDPTDKLEEIKRNYQDHARQKRENALEFTRRKQKLLDQKLMNINQTREQEIEYKREKQRLKQEEVRRQFQLEKQMRLVKNVRVLQKH